MNLKWIQSPLQINMPPPPRMACRGFLCYGTDITSEGARMTKVADGRNLVMVSSIGRGICKMSWHTL